jgi:aminoglycoside phosphotransferase (APT) family kinase protein
MVATLPLAAFAGLIPPGAVAALAATGEPSPRVTVLTGGRQVNLCLRLDGPGGARVLRLRRSPRDLPGADRAREIACQRAAAAAGLAPAVQAADAAEGWALMDFVPEAPWTAALLEDPARLDALCLRLRALHAVPPPAIAPFEAQDLLAAQAAAFARAGRAPPAEFAAAQRMAEALATLPRRPPVLCHGDLDVGNLLGPAPVLIDFEYAQIADPVYDVACLIAYYPQLERRALALLSAAGLGDAPSRARLPLQLGFSRLVNRVWAALQDETG